MTTDRATENDGPRLPRALLSRLLPDELRAEVLRDLGERWAYLCQRDGRFRATLWYWRQTLRSSGTRVPTVRTLRLQGPWKAVREELVNAARQVRRTPGFTATIVATLALGIGATSAVFSVVNGVLLEPLPYPEPDALVRVYAAAENRPDEHNFLSGAHYKAFRERNELFADLAAFYDYDELGADLSGDGGPERIVRMPVTANYFEVLGASPVLGRNFEPDEEIGFAAAAAMISHSLWSGRYGARPSVLGETLVLDGKSFEIVGVAPQSFVGPNGREVAVWTPIDLRPDSGNDFDNHYLSVVGRLADGAGVGAVGQALNALNAVLADENSDARLEYTHVLPLHHDMVGDAGAMLRLLMAAVGLVLLIVCVNVANLFLMRGTDRGEEMAIRATLGAGRVRLTGQLLAEGLLRALIGGALGVVTGWWAVRALVAMSPASLPRADTIGLDANVLLFAMATTVATGLLFAIVPAIRCSWSGSHRGGDTRATTGGRGQHRLRGGLVIGQVATALALLVASGALIESFLEIRRSDLGFDPAGVTTFEVHLPGATYDGGDRRVVFNEQLLDGVRAMQGVTAAGGVSVLPVTGRSFMWGLIGKHHREGDKPFLTDVRVVSGDYFEAMGVALRQGRWFESSDRGPGSRQVVLINQQVVDGYLGEEFRLGDQIRLAGVDRQVVGVVESTAVDPRGATAPKVYMPYGQAAFDRNWSITYVVRSNMNNRALLPQLREALDAIDGDRVVYRPGTMEQATRTARASERFSTLLMTIFAALALVITAVGIYGVLAVSVGQRTRELGIRAALGAEKGTLRAAVLGQALRLAGIGITIGIALLFALRGWLGSVVVLPEVQGPWLLAKVALVLVLVALTAAYLPARRATAVDAAKVLR